MAVEKLVKGLPAADLHPKLFLYLLCCPSCDMNIRFLPRAGGLMEQNYDDIFFFHLIEQRICEISNRKIPDKRK